MDVTVLLGCGGELSSSNGQPDASDDVTLNTAEDTGPEGDVSPGDDTQEDADLLGLDNDADDPEAAEDLAVPQATPWFGLTSGEGQLSSENCQLRVHDGISWTSSEPGNEVRLYFFTWNDEVVTTSAEATVAASFELGPGTYRFAMAPESTGTWGSSGAVHLPGHGDEPSPTAMTRSFVDLKPLPRPRQEARRLGRMQMPNTMMGAPTAPLNTVRPPMQPPDLPCRRCSRR